MAVNAWKCEVDSQVGKRKKRGQNDRNERLAERMKRDREETKARTKESKKEEGIRSLRASPN